MEQTRNRLPSADIHSTLQTHFAALPIFLGVSYDHGSNREDKMSNTNVLLSITLAISGRFYEP
jgi:hypothetical protein